MNLFIEFPSTALTSLMYADKVGAHFCTHHLIFVHNHLVTVMPHCVHPKKKKKNHPSLWCSGLIVYLRWLIRTFNTHNIPTFLAIYHKNQYFIQLLCVSVLEIN